MALPAENMPYTFADVLAWDESERAELIDGELVLLATPLREHQRISMVLCTIINNFLQGKPCQVYHAPFSVRPFARKEDRPEDVDTVLEPDITVVCDPEKLDKYGCRGAPDWIVEILSDSTQRHDRFVKYRLYEQAGVREYWSVDPEKQTVQVFRLEEGRYAAVDFQSAEGRVSSGVLEGLEIDLAAVFTEGAG